MVWQQEKISSNLAQNIRGKAARKLQQKAKGLEISL